MNTENLELKFIGDDELKTASSGIDMITDEIKSLSKNMTNIMYKKNGIGLAAPQIGINTRLVIIDIKDMEFEEFNTPGEALLIPQMPITLINPEITALNHGTSIMEEGCLSVPNIYADVERPNEVQLRARLLNGKVINVHCGGYLARVLQHEIDHLDGILFIDRLNEDDAKKINSKLKKLRKKLTKRK
jgi:peptide deformylase